LLEGAVEAANAPVVEADETTPDSEEEDRLTFATAAARDEAALAAYQRVISEHGDTDAAAFARLGAARALVSLGRAEEARPLYQAAADHGGENGIIGFQALEGIGAIQEGANDLAGAQATYEQLGQLSEHRFESVSKYHLARLQIARGEEDEARTALRELVAALRSEDADAPEPEFPYVLAQAEMRLRELDPSTAAAAPSFGGGGAGAEMDPQIQEMIRRMQAEAAAGGAGGGE
jgi:predicted negative regulator of RcsB-dependent stress response